MRIWIVTDKRQFLDCFETLQQVKQSVEMSYSNLELPKILHESDHKILWDNGIEASLLFVKTQPDHL